MTFSVTLRRLFLLSAGDKNIMVTLRCSIPNDSVFLDALPCGRHKGEMTDLLTLFKTSWFLESRAAVGWRGLQLWRTFPFAVCQTCAIDNQSRFPE
ncbi:hypothetical protein BaRGS_00035608 [Batillaria attramentaria]|uniref:Secreted protein n=1 Tax=Batillaria attramentaria TaxID=370345 RepID=A0ABD0JE91_9CAEN